MSKKEYEKLKKAGLCVTCGLTKPAIGILQCNYCSRKSKQSYQKNKAKYLETKRNKYQNLLDKGLCPICGGMRDTFYTLCSPCREKQNQQRKKRLKKEVENNV